MIFFLEPAVNIIKLELEKGISNSQHVFPVHKKHLPVPIILTLFHLNIFCKIEDFYNAPILGPMTFFVYIS